VQFYDRDEELLVTKVGHYLFEGWKDGEALLVVGAAERNRAIGEQLSALGLDPASVATSDRLLFLDGQQLVNRILAQGPPEWGRFDALIGSAVRELEARHGRVRAYGEMVGILWARKQYAEAERIEEFWNRLMRGVALSLFCAYPIDILHTDLDMTAVNAVLAAHTHVLPCGAEGTLGDAVDRAMDDVLGARAESLKRVITTYFRPSLAAVPTAERMVLWLRSHLPQYAGQILSRARHYYSTP
jgi:hypothetical protein